MTLGMTLVTGNLIGSLIAVTILTPFVVCKDLAAIPSK